jgi:hypothetical protein
MVVMAVPPVHRSSSQPLTRQPAIGDTVGRAIPSGSVVSRERTDPRGNGTFALIEATRAADRRPLLWAVVSMNSVATDPSIGPGGPTRAMA